MIDELTLRNARILVVDDEDPNVALLKRILEQAGFDQIEATTDARQAVPLFESFEPDIVLLDLLMPHLDGHQVMQHPRIPHGDYLPILVLTADTTAEAMQRSLTGGAKDFLTKPFDATEVLLRIQNLLETRFLHEQVRLQNESLEEKVRERTRDLEESQLEVVDRLALTAEFRDYETGRHTERVGRTALLVARALGRPEDWVRLIGRAAQLHDVGKIGIGDAILLKPGKLTPEEFEDVKQHTKIGVTILGGGKYPLIQLAEEIAKTHHERWDGSGYEGLAGEKIPLSGRITAVADVFDALTHDRPYKRAWPAKEAVDEIRAQSGKHFDPEVVDAFLNAHELGQILEAVVREGE